MSAAAIAIEFPWNPPSSGVAMDSATWLVCVCVLFAVDFVSKCTQAVRNTHTHSIIRRWRWKLYHYSLESMDTQPIIHLKQPLSDPPPFARPTIPHQKKIRISNEFYVLFSRYLAQPNLFIHVNFHSPQLCCAHSLFFRTNMIRGGSKGSSPFQLHLPALANLQSTKTNGEYCDENRTKPTSASNL